MSIKSFVLATSIIALTAGGALAQSSGGGATGIGGTTGGVGGTSGSMPVGPGSTSTNPNPTPKAGMTGSGMNNQDMNSNTTGSGRTSSPTRLDSSANTAAPSRSQIKQAQTALKQKGLYNGPVDGQVGPATRSAITQFQQQNGLKQSAQLDSSTMSSLQGNSNASGSGARSYSQPPAGTGGANMSSPPSSPDRM